jgi:hypothetical protein
MTKPANFPGRVFLRRQGAAARLLAKGPRKHRVTNEYLLARQNEIGALRNLIAGGHASAFNTQTKKDRSARGRLSR